MMRVAVCAFLAAALGLAAGGPTWAGERKRLGEAVGGFRPVAIEALAGVPLSGSLSLAERGYLGVAASGPFTIAGVGGELLVVEFFNSACYACALMAPVMDEAWRRVDTRPELRGRVRFLGIGAGNTPGQVLEFHEGHGTPFPMIADPEFAAFDALGTMEGTPYLLLVRRGADGSVSARAQVGYVADAGAIVREIVDALAGAPAGDDRPREVGGAAWRTLKPPLPAAQLEDRVARAAAAAGLPGASARAVPLPGGGTFYRLSAGGRSLWAYVAGRSRVCNVCHDIFFIVLFDEAGTIVGLEPISITKYKNVELDERDVAFLRSRVVGRMLARGIVFDPAVDAVSQATMSSALVFDTLRRLGETWKDMVAAGNSLP
ncbi:MAG TPA: hypothetical protein VI078_16110 [bacterium]